MKVTGCFISPHPGRSRHPASRDTCTSLYIGLLPIKGVLKSVPEGEGTSSVTFPETYNRAMVTSLAAGLLLLLGAAPITAAPLDEALLLARQQSAEVTARKMEARAVARQSTWTSEVRLAYNAQSTEAQAGGLDAGLSVRIPLFDRKQALAAVRARAQLAEAEQALRTRFVVAVADLIERAGRVAGSAGTVAFNQDRLAYARQAVAEGRAGADSLWAVAREVREAQQQAAEAERAYRVQLETLARSYGGKQWTTLQALLAAHVKRTTLSTPSAAAATSW